jgi:hypothetical protein
VTRDNLHRWAQEYAARLRERAGELDRYVEASLVLRHSGEPSGEPPLWFGQGGKRSAPRRIAARQLLHRDAPKRCLLLGPAGCGKTLTCKFLAQRLLEPFLDGEETRFPVLLPGSELRGDGDSLRDEIHRHLANLTPGPEFEMIIRAAQEGKMVLLLDALDESAPAAQTSRVHAVERWVLGNPVSSCIVTCREPGAPGFWNFQEYEFLPFTEQDSQEFVSKRLPGKEGQRFLMALLEMGSPSLLASPLLLSHFIQGYARTGVIPDPATFTFADLVNRLFSQSVSAERRVTITALLAQLAKRMMSEGSRTASRQVVSDIVHSNPHLFSSWNDDLDSLMDALFRTHCLVEESDGRVAFTHLRLLEYFAKSFLGPIDQIWTPSITIPPKTIEVVRFVDQEVVRRLAKEPRDLHCLPPRKFEELIAELFRDRGWSVELTKQTRDGGSDIIAVRGDVGSHVKMLIEAKRYSPDRPVGVGLVRQLYAVRQLRHASKAVLATTSYFSPDACKEFAEFIPWELELDDYDQILRWLKSYRGE